MAQLPVIQSMKSDRQPPQTKAFEFIPKHQGPINAKHRDAFFSDVGFNDDLRAFDDVEKNVLYLRLKKFDIQRLKELYPLVSPATLENAQKALGKL